MPLKRIKSYSFKKGGFVRAGQGKWRIRASKIKMYRGLTRRVRKGQAPEFGEGYKTLYWSFVRNPTNLFKLNLCILFALINQSLENWPQSPGILFTHLLRYERSEASHRPFHLTFEIAIRHSQFVIRHSPSPPVKKAITVDAKILFIIIYSNLPPNQLSE